MGTAEGVAVSVSVRSTVAVVMAIVSVSVTVVVIVVVPDSCSGGGDGDGIISVACCVAEGVSRLLGGAARTACSCLGMETADAVAASSMRLRVWNFMFLVVCALALPD